MEYCLVKRTLTIALAINLLSVVQTDNFRWTHLEPPGTLYKVVGERLDLECSYFKDDKTNLSDSLSMQRCRSRVCVTLPSETINRTSIRTSIESLLVEDGQTYKCSFKLQQDTMSLTYVKVGYRPSPPKDIYCFSRNHLDMNCTVTLADRDARSELVPNITVYFQSTRSTKWLKCPNYNARYHYCYWRAPPISGKDLDNDFVINRGYIILVKVMNVLGSDQSELPIDDTSTIVTISNLHQFKGINITSRKAVLTWGLPEALFPVTFDIDFEINYTSKWDPEKQIIYRSKKQMRKVMKDLIPNTKYDVSIRARGRRMVLDERSWSPVNKVSFKTKKDAPSAAPRSTVGGYFLSRPGINNTGDNCALQIYLKPVPKKQRNCDLSDMSYRVTLEGETNPEYKVVDPAATLILVLSHKSCLNKGPNRVIVQACTEGYQCSRKRSVIHIPSVDKDSDTEIPRATEVIVEGFGDTHFTVSWSTAAYVNASLVRQVTIFWCRGNKDQHVCERNLSWKIIKKYVANADIEVKHLNYRNWIFAVSLTTHKGKSGGMAFADCQFLYDKTESQEITAVASVKPTFNLLTGNSMKSLDIVSLSFRYCDVQFLNRKPEQYEVFYKKASGDEEEDCMEGAQSFNVTACVSLQEIVLPDLDPMAQYSVCMRIRTSVGASKLSDVRWRKPLKHPGGVDAVLVGGLSTVSIIVFLLILTFVIWRCYLKYENMDAKIELPSVDTDHQSIVETSKSRQASNGDSGFDSQYVSPHKSEEKKRSMQYRTASPQLQSEGSFEDIDKITGNHQSQVSGNKNRTGVTTKRLTEPEPDCSYTGHKINQTCLRASCATNSTTNTNKNSCADCYWIASGFHDRDSGECFLEGDEKEPFIKTDEYSKALSLIPTDLQNSKDANSTVVLDRSSYSYKKQLDMEVILSVGDSENEACNYSDHSDSTLYSDLSKDDLDQIASLEDLLSEETVTRHENKSFTGVNSNHINPGNYGHSQLRSNSDNPSERTSLVKSHKPFAVSLETSCTEESRYGTNSNPSHIQDDNSEKERLLAYLQSDDKVEHTYSDPDNDFSIAHSGTYCEPEKHLSGTYCEPEKHLSGTGCEPHKHHSGTYCKPDKDISDTCCEPYKDYSGTGCEPHKDLSGTRCESDNDISDTCFEPHKDHPGTCSEPHGDQFDICYEVDGDNCDTNIVPHEDQFNTMSCCELRKEQSGICREPSREKYCMCFGPKPLHTTNSLRNCEQHVPYKTLDDNRKTKVKSKGYVKKIC